nr:helix-turn-helix transcriptional regulator [uncultured Dorea sp.]
MELGSQIKKYRNDLSLSQDALAQKVYVSRQTISNWENDKSYPDVNSLILLSNVFNTSIDNLVKGDIEIMREEIKKEDRMEVEKLGGIFGILLLAAVVTPIPLVYFLKFVGVAIWVLLYVVTMYVCILVEKKKKQFNIKTYKEITAFMDGVRLDEITKAKEEGKRPYQQVLLAVGSGLITFAIAYIFEMILK